MDIKQDKDIEKQRKRLAEILYKDLVKRSEVELGEQKLPPKSKIIQMIYSYINQFTKKTLNQMIGTYSKRKTIVDGIIDSIVAYF